MTQNDEQLTDNFSLSEFTKSQTALRHGIKNEPTRTEINALKLLCINVLQPMRRLFGPIIVTSGFRGKKLNEMIGGSPRSQHRWGQAADIEAVRISNPQLAYEIASRCDFDQLILEYYDGVDPRSGWVHVSYVSPENNRRQILRTEGAGGYVVMTIDELKELV